MGATGNDVWIPRLVVTFLGLVAFAPFVSNLLSIQPTPGLEASSNNALGSLGVIVFALWRSGASRRQRRKNGGNGPAIT